MVYDIYSKREGARDKIKHIRPRRRREAERKGGEDQQGFEGGHELSCRLMRLHDQEDR